MTRGLSSVDRGLGAFLLLLVICSILPVALTFTFGVGIPFVLTVMLGYFTQIVICFFVALKWGIQPKDPWIIIAVVYLILQLLTLSFVTIQQGSYEVLDLVGAYSKVVGVLLFAGVMQGLRPSALEVDKFLKGFLLITGSALLTSAILDFGEFSKILSATSSHQVSFSSFFANRNQFGSFLFLGIVVNALYMYNRKLRIINVLFFLIQIGFLLLTLSRGAILATFVFFTVFALFTLRDRPRYMFWVASFLVVGGTVLVFSSFGDQIRTLVLRPDSGVSGRDTIWEHGIQVWQTTNLILGNGSFRGIELAQSAGMQFSEFHSFFVETLVSGGIVELILLVVIVAIVWRRLAKSNLDNYRRYLLYSAGVGVLMLSVFESISIFTMGFVGTIFSIFVISLPIIYTNLSDASRSRVGS